MSRKDHIESSYFEPARRSCFQILENILESREVFRISINQSLMRLNHTLGLISTPDR